MKKTLVASYIDGLRDETHGVSYENIMFSFIAILRDTTLRARWKSWYYSWSWNFARRICILSWPVMCDKSVLAIAKMLLVRAIAPMGDLALGRFGAIKDLEMFAFVPAV
jgi:Na+-driven multidrug efflux pump